MSAREVKNVLSALDFTWYNLACLVFSANYKSGKDYGNFEKLRLQYKYNIIEIGEYIYDDIKEEEPNSAILRYNETKLYALNKLRWNFEVNEHKKYFKVEKIIDLGADRYAFIINNEKLKYKLFSWMEIDEDKHWIICEQQSYESLEELETLNPELREVILRVINNFRIIYDAKNPINNNRNLEKELKNAVNITSYLKKFDKMDYERTKDFPEREFNIYNPLTYAQLNNFIEMTNIAYKISGDMGGYTTKDILVKDIINNTGHGGALILVLENLITKEHFAAVLKKDEDGIWHGVNRVDLTKESTQYS